MEEILVPLGVYKYLLIDEHRRLKNVEGDNTVLEV
jgi:hypothetical protein